MKGFSDWANKNPKQAGAAAGGALLLAIIIIYFTQFAGSGGDSAAGTGAAKTTGTTAGATTAGATTAGATTAGATTTGSPAGAATGGYPSAGGMTGGYPPGGGAMASAGGASDADELTKGKVPAGRINPMAPYWLVSLPSPPHGPRRNNTTTTTTGTTTDLGVFTPPTPGVSMLSNFWNYYRETGVRAPVYTPPVSNTRPSPEIGNAVGPPQRMAGIVYGADRVAAVIERGSTDATQPAISYVVQPGDQVGDETVISISPDSAVLRKADGTLETVTLKAGSLKGLAPASEGFGSGMPGYPGYPGMGYPGGGYPGMGYPGGGYPGGGYPGGGYPGGGYPAVRTFGPGSPPI